MTVYVDNAMIPYRGMLMSHMISDTTEELRAMSQRIDVSWRWVQYAGTPKEHMDICASKRQQAIKAGAVEVTSRAIAEMIRRRRR